MSQLRQLPICKPPSTHRLLLSINCTVSSDTVAGWMWQRRIVVARVDVLKFQRLWRLWLNRVSADPPGPNLLPEIPPVTYLAISQLLLATPRRILFSRNPFPLVLSITMLSRRVLVASRFLRAQRAPQLRYPFPVIQQFRSYADRVVKVPEMAESISEGTLKQWSKQVGEYVQADEEIATIETDKASLHAPLPSNVIREFTG